MMMASPLTKRLRTRSERTSGGKRERECPGNSNAVIDANVTMKTRKSFWSNGVGPAFISMVDDYKILNDKDFDMSVTGKNS